MYFKSIIAPMLDMLSSNRHGKLEHPLERFVVLRVDRLEVSHVDRSCAENLPIEGSSEVPIKGTTTVAQR
jgi:hypothetical protein